MSGAIQQAVKSQQEAQLAPTMQSYIRQMSNEIKKALPSVLTPDRFTRITLSAISANPKLGETSPASFLGAMMTAAQLGLEPNTPLGHAYLIPYRNKGVLECQFQIGYRGLIDLAYRSGEISTIQAHTVYENDAFEYEFGLDAKLKHIPCKSGRGNPTWFYAVYKTRDGGFGFEVMSVEDVRAHAKKYSKAYSNGPWQTNFEEMAKKTVLKQALKYAPLKAEFVRAVSADETIKTELSEDMFSVPNKLIDVEGYEVDEETGEVKEQSEGTGTDT
ncbi:recombinase RecT [Anaeromassilibacillus senegalensis]|uniref:recombinase RecT n=1 Tax=Anaeromassilibacillus senegalensis TaxID=1673717 RepID=UPI000A53CF54|nr:recombinase RecT [Anaeromassilibacillus senegalensis]